jgi:indole-3-glycerol phosphate synthase
MILDEICAYKRDVVEEAKRVKSLGDHIEQIESVRPARNFHAALRKDGMSLIAEVKMASPSKGVMLEGVKPIELASLYESCKASAISVLTDEKYFQGSLTNLVEIERYVSIPCLRKEFIIDAYQIYEARSAGADAILLIVSILSDAELKEFRELAESMGMGVLVEAHSEDEIKRGLNSGAKIIGVNNRDLTTFEVNYQNTLELKKHVPGGVVLVSESGIHTREHVVKLEDGGVDAILVGEAFVTSDDIAAKVRELMGYGEY